MTEHSNLANSLRRLLFTRNDRLYLKGESPVTYEVKAGLKDLATGTWAVHGICLGCQRFSIAAGRCAECGVIYCDPKTPEYIRDKLIQEQFDQAKRLI